VCCWGCSVAVVAVNVGDGDGDDDNAVADVVVDGTVAVVLFCSF
jgi:hypothetical protein